VIQRL